MRKILEVLDYGDMDIRFNTDIDVTKNPDEVMEVNSKVLYAMLTTLWGGNEISVLAMIRALAIADVAASVNPDEMIRNLRKASSFMRDMIRKFEKEVEKEGGTIQHFAPGIKPGQYKN